jgi:D-alanyl-lipoteichoic acid acyltransferase DltB (MBOAT superfamily)
MLAQLTLMDNAPDLYIPWVSFFVIFEYRDILADTRNGKAKRSNAEPIMNFHIFSSYVPIKKRTISINFH